MAKRRNKGKEFCDLVMEGKDVRAALDELGMSDQEASELVDMMSVLLDRDQVERCQDGGVKIHGSQLDRIEMRVEGLRRELQGLQVGMVELETAVIELRRAVDRLVEQDASRGSYGKARVLQFRNKPKAG